MYGSRKHTFLIWCLFWQIPPIPSRGLRAGSEQLIKYSGISVQFLEEILLLYSEGTLLSFQALKTKLDSWVILSRSNTPGKSLWIVRVGTCKIFCSCRVLWSTKMIILDQEKKWHSTFDLCPTRKLNSGMNQFFWKCRGYGGKMELAHFLVTYSYSYLLKLQLEA